MQRRAVLLSLLAAACAPRRLVYPPPPDALRLGWRFVPGWRLLYDLHVEHELGGVVRRRIERWAYQVVARDRGVATLHGHLVGLGADERPEQLSEEALQRMLSVQRGQGGAVVLRLGVDGRLRPQPGLDCTAVGDAGRECFGAQVGHRLLALPLPPDPVQHGASWRDADLGAPFAPLLPPGLDIAADGRCAVADIYADPDGAPRVDLRSTLLLRAQGGLALRAEGIATWDPLAGALQRRTLRARLGGGLGPPAGALTLTLTRRS